jgi:hypothetical protein
VVALAALLGLGVLAATNPTGARADPAPTGSTAPTGPAGGTSGSGALTPSSPPAPTPATTPAPPPSTTAPSTSTAPPATTPVPSSALTTAPSTTPPAATVAGPTREWTLTASRLDMGGLSYHGLVDAVVGGQTIQVLYFTVTSLRITDLVQTADLGAGHSLVTSAAPGSVSTVDSDTITLLTDRLQGNLDLLGIKIPVDYSASNPPPLTIPWVTFTDVTAHNTDLRGGSLHIPGARITVT